MKPTTKTREAIQWTGLIAGPIVAAACYPLLPTEYQAAGGEVVEFTATGRATLAVMIWMAIWWLSEAIHISATALLPLAVFPLLGAADIKASAAPYADPVIFLFMGGFLLALSMQRWGLGKRIALMTLSLTGARPVRMVAGFMAATAVLSAFVSNTATTAMMLPIALSVLALVRTSDDKDDNADPADDDPTKKLSADQDESDNFAVCLMLGIAYAASIGGIATIIGTPPNVVLVGFLRDNIAEPYRTDISFASWLPIGVPLVVAFLPIVLLLLTRVLYPIRIGEIKGGSELIRNELKSLGPVNRGQWVTFIVFMLAATLWITRPWLQQIAFQIGETKFAPLAGLSDAGIAMSAALLLFVIPARRGERTFVMDWETARQLPWGILILFGGGLSLAKAIDANGVADFIGSHARVLAGMPTIVLIAVVAAGIVYLTELTSNTATITAMLPILAAMAPGLGIHPYLLIFPAAMAASCAFMLPVATPPNAIVFASGRITMPQMIRAGFWLNLIGVVLVTLLSYFVVGPLLGLEM